MPSLPEYYVNVNVGQTVAQIRESNQILKFQHFVQLVIPMDFKCLQICVALGLQLCDNVSQILHFVAPLLILPQQIGVHQFDGLCEIRTFYFSRT